jgi:hypothetical protein
MAYVTDMGLLIHFDPKKAKTLILDAFRAEKCHKGNTAHRIGCSHRTLLVWMKKLGIDAEIDRIYELAVKEGWNLADQLKRQRPPRGEKAGAYRAKVKPSAKVRGSGGGKKRPRSTKATTRKAA